MIFKELKIRGAFLISAETYKDKRGIFRRNFCEKEFERYNEIINCKSQRIFLEWDNYKTYYSSPDYNIFEHQIADIEMLKIQDYLDSSTDSNARKEQEWFLDFINTNYSFHSKFKSWTFVKLK